MKISNIKTPMSPTKEIIDSMMVHDNKVCWSERLKNSLNIQKPESLMCDPKTLPAPTASTISSGLTPPMIKGDTIPAAVIPATVAEPIVILKKAVITQANKMVDIFHFDENAAIYSLEPLSVNTCLNTPPVVMINMMTAIPEMASCTHFI